jgi:hypothetical protein
MFRPGKVMKTMARPGFRSSRTSENVACFSVSLSPPIFYHSGQKHYGYRYGGHPGLLLSETVGEKRLLA